MGKLVKKVVLFEYSFYVSISYFKDFTVCYQGTYLPLDQLVTWNFFKILMSVIALRFNATLH